MGMIVKGAWINIEDNKRTVGLTMNSLNKEELLMVAESLTLLAQVIVVMDSTGMPYHAAMAEVFGKSYVGTI
jgi:hypothetical protein